MPADRKRSEGGHASPTAVPADGLPGLSTSEWAIVSPVKQDAPGFIKTWWCHPRADLFCWCLPDSTITAFQFCFDKGEKEHMLAWDRDRPTAVGAIDSGESTPEHNRSPILVEHGPLQKSPRARDAWLDVKSGLPDPLVEFIEHALGWD